MIDLISNQAAIDVNGLDEEIRCEMCKNPMQTDRGCDGNCKYDEILYERIIQLLNKRITLLPLAQPESCEDAVSRQAAIEVVDAVWSVTGDKNVAKVWDQIKDLPSAQPDDWMERNKERILQAGMEGREIEFRIGGRLFAIREKAQ